MNTKIHYLYRDAANYKQHGAEVVSGTVPQEEIYDLWDNYYEQLACFYPENIGFQSWAFADTGWGRYDDDPDFHEVDAFETTDDDPTQPITIEQFIAAIKDGSLSIPPETPVKEAATLLKKALGEYCRMRINNCLCAEDVCGFCPVNRVYEMAKKDGA